jgi:hypothetical protein
MDGWVALNAAFVFTLSVDLLLLPVGTVAHPFAHKSMRLLCFP